MNYGPGRSIARRLSFAACLLMLSFSLNGCCLPCGMLANLAVTLSAKCGPGGCPPGQGQGAPNPQAPGTTDEKTQNPQAPEKTENKNPQAAGNTQEKLANTASSQLGQGIGQNVANDTRPPSGAF